MKNNLLLISERKSLIFSKGMEYSPKQFLVGSSSPYLNERTGNILMLLNVKSIIKPKLLFFGCVVISDLYLFQETVILKPCFKFFKNLMLSFIDKDTTGT